MVIKIKDSYLINDTDELYLVIGQYKDLGNFPHRSDYSLVSEWKAHNRLYKLGLFKSHTKDVDLEDPLKWYLSLIYLILGVHER